MTITQFLRNCTYVNGFYVPNNVNANEERYVIQARCSSCRLQ